MTFTNGVNPNFTNFPSLSANASAVSQPLSSTTQLSLNTQQSTAASSGANGQAAGMQQMVFQLLSMILTMLTQMFVGQAPDQPSNGGNAGNAGNAGNNGHTPSPAPSPSPTPAPTPCPAPPSYNGGNDGKYWGDPHLVGFDGEKYDVMGQPGKIYNMLSDKNIQYNTQFDAWGDKGNTVIGKAGIQVGDSKVEFDRSGAPPKVDGQVMKVGQQVKLDKNGTADWDGKKLLVTTDEYTIDLEVKKQDHANGPYLDSNVKINKMGPFQDMVAPHGLLGQTADGIEGHKNSGRDQGKQGGTVIDGTVKDYEEADLWSGSSKFNRFGVEIKKITTVDGSDQVDTVTDAKGNVLFKNPGLVKAA